MATKPQATIEDLYNIPEHGKAELVDGEIVLMPPTGARPGSAGAEIFVSLRQYARRTKRGRAVPENVGFRVNLPNRRSFSPDVAYHVGADTGMKFYDSAPIFAVEVRSDGDYGINAERAIAQKRADYFAAGTLVVWDVDLVRPDTIASYRSDAPNEPIILRPGDIAHAEPALPGWTMRVDELFV